MPGGGGPLADSFQPRLPRSGPPRSSSRHLDDLPPPPWSKLRRESFQPPPPPPPCGFGASELPSPTSAELTCARTERIARARESEERARRASRRDEKRRREATKTKTNVEGREGIRPSSRPIHPTAGRRSDGRTGRSRARIVDRVGIESNRTLTCCGASPGAGPLLNPPSHSVETRRMGMMMRRGGQPTRRERRRAARGRRTGRRAARRRGRAPRRTRGGSS